MEFSLGECLTGAMIAGAMVVSAGAKNIRGGAVSAGRAHRSRGGVRRHASRGGREGCPPAPLPAGVPPGSRGGRLLPSCKGQPQPPEFDLDRMSGVRVACATSGAFTCAVSIRRRRVAFACSPAPGGLAVARRSRGSPVGRARRHARALGCRVVRLPGACRQADIKGVFPWCRS